MFVELQDIEKVFGEGGKGLVEAKQLTMGSEGEVVEGEASTLLRPVEAEVIDEGVDFLDEQFPEIDDGIKVRPLLKNEDLRLIRRLFMVAIRSDGTGADEMGARVLMRRILKKVKG